MPIPMSLLSGLAAWALVTIGLIVVATYRGLLDKDETDRMFVGEGQSHLAMQQQQIIAKVSRLDQVVKRLAVASGVLLVVCLAIWLWSSFSNL